MTNALDVDAIQEAVRTRYAEVAHTAVGKFAYPTGRAGAVGLGYDLSSLVDTPDDMLESFCGVGNPFLLGAYQPGDVGLAVGCGAGFDGLVASRYVGPTGRVYGVDLTPAVVQHAQEHLRRVGVDQARAVLAGVEALPFPEATFDVVTSNGVLNLSPLKDKSLQEICRVLKPNGRFQFADIVLQEALPAEVANNLEAWSE